MERRIRRAMLICMAAFMAVLPLPAMGAEEGAAVGENEEMTSWTDSLGRVHELPASIDRISPSGNLAQMMLYALAPEKMVGLARPLSANAMDFMLPGIKELPSFGNFFASKSTFNREAIIMADPDILLDVGEVKRNMVEDFEALEKELGIPVVFIEGHLENTGDTIRELGRLTGLEERAEELAAYADRAVSYAIEKRAQIEKPVRGYYSSSPDGLGGFPTGSFHGEIIEFLGIENVVPEGFSETENRLSLEQLFVWNPDVMFIQNRDAWKHITTDPEWAGLDAVKNGRVYLIPILPYPFLSNPPALNRLMGIWWAGKLCYPGLYADIDLVEEMKTFYSLFYHYELTDAEAEKILSE